MRRALLPGSFDPFTNGHLDVLNRAAKLFDEIVIVVAGTGQKTPLLTPEERVALIRDVVKDRPNIRVDICKGLIMDYARIHGACAVVRGLRAASDFEYEFMMAHMNHNLNRDVETVFVTTSQDLFFVSSTMIKELHRYGGDISPYVPANVLKALKTKGATP